MSNPNDHSFEACQEIADEQGWNDESLLGMLIGWLEQNVHCEQVRAQLRANADEENALAETEPEPEWEVIVGNIGTVYSGPDEELAKIKYESYVEDSGLNSGRAAGENVVLMCDGEIVQEYIGDLHRGEED